MSDIEIPLHVNNYGVWYEGWRFLGMSTTTLPNCANLTDTYKGAGHGGETNYPIKNHYADWEVVFNFHAITRRSAYLMREESILVEVMPGIEYQDPATHRIKVRGWRFSLVVIPKGPDLGSLEVGAKQNLVIPCACTYIKAVFAGETIFEKDKVNIINEVLHEDFARDVREAIGII